MFDDFMALTQHLQNDLFNIAESGDTLYIFDDYNVTGKLLKKAEEDADYLSKIAEAICSVEKIKRVIILNQKKKSKNYLVDAEVDNLFLLKAPNEKTNRDNIRSAKKNARKDYFAKKRFIEDFAKHGRACQYVVYDPGFVDPPFHGRYWLSKTSGFIVDGSLNTVPDKLVLVQTLDPENYGIIREMTQGLISGRFDDACCFDKEKLDRAFSRAEAAYEAALTLCRNQR